MLHLYCFFVISSIYAQICTFILLLSNAYLQHSNLCSTSFLASLQITISSANIIVHDGFFLTSSVSLSIIIANRSGHNADPWCSPTLTLKLSVVPIAHLTTVSLFSYMSCTSRTYFSLFLILSYRTTALSAEPCRKLSLGLRIHNVAIFDLPCTFLLTFLRQT